VSRGKIRRVDLHVNGATAEPSDQVVRVLADRLENCRLAGAKPVSPRNR
jgi:hypothetical protein